MPNPKKTDESVKSGLEIASHPVSKPETEKDPDDLVHEQRDIQPNEAEEQDVDDLVHEQPASPVIDDMEEKDPDDLVHEPNSGEDQN